MTRLFTVLAWLDALLLVASYLLGVVSKLRHGVQTGDPIYWYHFLCGLTTALVTLLVHCLIFTYFLGTGRWVKEVRLAYDLPYAPLHKQTRDLKRRVFPPALFAMLGAAFTGMAGAAAHVQVWPWEVHFSLATLTLFLNFWAFRVEYQCLQANAVVLQEVLREVDEIRARRGLPSNTEALEQDRRSHPAVPEPPPNKPPK
jgi:hypothetical protein